MKKVIIMLNDGTRHEAEVSEEALTRGKFEYSPELNRPASPYPSRPPLDLTVRHCYRAGSDEGVPVFAER